MALLILLICFVNGMLMKLHLVQTKIVVKSRGDIKEEAVSKICKCSVNIGGA